MKRLQIAEELQGVGTDGLSLAGIDAVAASRGEHALPALMFEFPVRGGAGVLLGQHLRENAISQAKR